MKKTILFVLALFVCSAFAEQETVTVNGKKYSNKKIFYTADYVNQKNLRLGEKKDIPCPCVFSRKRHSDPEYEVYSTGDLSWKCAKRYSNGKCKGVQVRSE